MEKLPIGSFSAAPWLTALLLARISAGACHLAEARRRGGQ
jgi:hypothetical protein